MFEYSINRALVCGYEVLSSKFVELRRVTDDFRCTEVEKKGGGKKSFWKAFKREKLDMLAKYRSPTPEAICKSNAIS